MSDQEPQQLEFGLDDAGTLRKLLHSISEGAYVAAPDGRILDANRAFVELFGADDLDHLKRLDRSALWVDTGRRDELERQVQERGSVHEFELLARRLDGVEITVLDTCHAHRDAKGGLVAYYGVVIDVSEKRTWEQQLAELNVRDPLTGCYNRRYLDTQRHLLERPSYFWGCLVLDLEGFSEVNENFGHEEGDRVLQRFAHFIIRNKRADDVLIRLGGDDFALLVEVVAPENLDVIAERLVSTAPRQSPLGFSIGHAYRSAGEPVDQVLKRASEHSYTGKIERPRPERRRSD